MAEAKSDAAREFVLTRMIRAPRERVFRAWTDPNEFVKWWGPNGFTIPVCEMDVRVGGNYRCVMRSPDGIDFPAKGKYLEVDPPRKLAYSVDMSEHPKEWFDHIFAEMPKGESFSINELAIAVTFEDQDGKTLLTIRSLFDTSHVRDAFVKTGMSEGWRQILDKLEQLLV